MSDVSSKKIYAEKNEFTLFHVLDFSVLDTAVGCYTLDFELPPYHQVVGATLFPETALDSAGDAVTISVGTDDVASEPDNLLNDITQASLQTAVANGTPTDAALVDTGSDEAPVAYEVKTEAITAGKLVLGVTLRPYR